MNNYNLNKNGNVNFLILIVILICSGLALSLMSIGSDNLKLGQVMEDRLAIRCDIRNNLQELLRGKLYYDQIQQSIVSGFKNPNRTIDNYIGASNFKHLNSINNSYAKLKVKGQDMKLTVYSYFKGDKSEYVIEAYKYNLINPIFLDEELNSREISRYYERFSKKFIEAKYFYSKDYANDYDLDQANNRVYMGRSGGINYIELDSKGDFLRYDLEGESLRLLIRNKTSSGGLSIEKEVIEGEPVHSNLSLEGLIYVEGDLIIDGVFNFKGLIFLKDGSLILKDDGEFNLDGNIVCKNRKELSFNYNPKSFYENGLSLPGFLDPILWGRDIER